MPISLPINLDGMIAQGKDTPIACIKGVINDYFSLVGNPRRETIYRRRIDEKNVTLNSIAVDFNVTRERIRQICQEHKFDIIALLNGKTIHSPHCCACPHALQKIYGSIDFTKSIILKSHLISALKASPDDNRIDGYLNVVMGAKEFVRQKYEDIEFYASPKIGSDVVRMCKDIYYNLQSSTLPETLEKISKATKIVPWLIQELMPLIPHVSMTEDHKYFLPMNELKTYRDRAYRLLSEKGIPLHYTEINELIGRKKNAPNGYLVLDDRFKPIRKSGNWALKEWTVDDRPLIEIMEKALNLIGKPATIPEIVKCMKTAMPHIIPGYVHSYLKLCGGKKFCWTLDGKACLVSWKLSGTLTKRPPYEPKNLLSTVEFGKKIKDAMGGQELSNEKVKEIASNTFPSLKKSTIAWRVYYCPGLIRTHKDGLLYFKVDPHYIAPIVTEKKRSTAAPKKTISLIKDITRILKKEGKKRRSDIVRMLNPKGYSKPLIYKTIMNHPGFSVTVYSQFKSFVKLVK